MARIVESWRSLFRSIAVPTLLIACPIGLARYWFAWRHFLSPIDAFTQCLLVATSVLVIEALAALVLSILFEFMIRHGSVERTALGKCADVLTLLVLGYSVCLVLAGSRWLNPLHPVLLAEIATAAIIFITLRSNKSDLQFDQYNRSSEAIVPVFFVALAILLPGRVVWRRFDPLPLDPSVARAAQSKPDVVVITFDALSANDMSLFHYALPTTPNFEQLAKTSHVFSHFYSSSDFTTPAVVSLITGKDLISHRVYQLAGMIPAAVRDQNLAHLLALNGYRTAAVVTNKYAHPLHLGIDDSFDYLPEPPANPWLRPLNWPLQLGHTLLFDSNASPTGLIEPFLRATGAYIPSFNQNSNVDSNEVFALSERLMDSVRGPLFIWIHLFAPHFPYVTRPPFRGHFLKGDEYTTQADFHVAESRFGDYRADMQPEYDKLRARYDESVAESDAALGGFLKWLDLRGRRAHTLVVVGADHGEVFHHFWWHGSAFLLYPEVHIPLLISLPGQKTGVWHDQDAGLADVAPTILAVLGIAVPTWMTGHALLGPSATGKDHQPALAAYLLRSYIFGAPQEGTIAAFSGDYELVWYFPLGVRWLFDIRRDPEGTVNVLSDHQNIAALMTHSIRLKWGAQVPALRDR
jgi:arylsulfatase A-like enzyme